jgi:hypothetical protein
VTRTAEYRIHEGQSGGIGQGAAWRGALYEIAKVEWHPGELYPRVGFIVTNLSRPADRVVAFYNKRGTCEQWIKEGKGAIKWTRLSCRTLAANAVRAPASCARLQSRQFPAHAGDARANQGLVADELEGEADQDRRESGEPRPLCCLPDGRGRHPTANVPGDFAIDRGTTTAAATNARVRRRSSRIQKHPTGGVRPNASENSQIKPSTVVRAARAAGSHPHLAS